MRKVDTINSDNMRKGERKLDDSWSLIRMFYFVFKMGYMKARFHLIETKCLLKMSAWITTASRGERRILLLSKSEGKFSDGFLI